MPVDPILFANDAVREDWIRNKNLLVFSLQADRYRFFALDIFVTEPFPFDEMASQAKIANVEGRDFRIAAIRHLTIMKERAARPQDFSDIEALEFIEEVRRHDSQ